MKCVSCETDINPKWKHAIDINVCPFCGLHIVEEHLKNCLVALNAAMEAMLTYPEQLNDWMISNHSYIKTDSPELVNYLPKGILRELRKEVDNVDFQEKKQSIVTIKLPGGGTEDVLVEKTQSEAKTNSFFERAEVLKGSGKTSNKAAKGPEQPEAPKSVAEKTQNLREKVRQIQSAGSPSTPSEETGVVSMISPEMLNNADPEAVAEFQAILNSSDIINSGLPPASNGEEDDATMERVLANNMRMAAKKGPVSQEKDMDTLRDMQNRVANAQKRLGSGGFSRS